MKNILVLTFALILLVGVSHATTVDVEMEETAEAVDMLNSFAKESLRHHLFGDDTPSSSDDQLNPSTPAPTDAPTEQSTDWKTTSSGGGRVMTQSSNLPVSNSNLNVQFSWTNVNVRNFLTWLVNQQDDKGALSDMQMVMESELKRRRGKGKGKHGKGKGKKKLTKKQRAAIKLYEAIRKLQTAGQHAGYYWYRVKVHGNMNSGNIMQACKKLNLQVPCDHTSYSDGQCVNTNYDQGRHISYPGHAIEGWQNGGFFTNAYIYCGNANGGLPLQNTGSTHRWAGYSESDGDTVCISSQPNHRPKFMGKEHRRKKHHEHHELLEIVSKQVQQQGITAFRTAAAANFLSMTAEEKLRLMDEPAATTKAPTPTPKKEEDDAVIVQFRWSKVDVRNFMSWLVMQNPAFGSMKTLKMAMMPPTKAPSVKKAIVIPKLNAQQIAHNERVAKLQSLPTAGEHGGYWWYKVRVRGQMNSGNIEQACQSVSMKPACDHSSYSDGKCTLTSFSIGRHLSYPGHHQESGWQNAFFANAYMYCGSANGGQSLQDYEGTHRWSDSSDTNGYTVCVDSQKPPKAIMPKVPKHLRHQIHEELKLKHSREVLEKIEKLEKGGEHAGYWWYKVPVDGTMNSEDILQACRELDMKPACAYSSYSNGQCVDTMYDSGRYLSYPPHYLESWQTSFLQNLYVYSGSANNGRSLQNSGGSHRWSNNGDKNGYTVCLDPRNPHKLKHEAEGHKKKKADGEGDADSEQAN